MFGRESQSVSRRPAKERAVTEIDLEVLWQ